MEFHGKTCVVTGGANGIGRCLVERFAAAGADIAFIDTDESAGQELRQALAKIGTAVEFQHGDIADEAVLHGFAKRVAARFGKVDALINNACLSRAGILSGCGFDDFNYVLRLGVTAPYMLARLFLDRFAPGASIVNIASTRAFQSQADTESYSAAKGGITALTHALSVSLAGRVRVNAVSPGWVETGPWHTPPLTPAHAPADERQHPAGRVGRPDDIAAMVIFLCSDRASFITGQNFTVDGGMSRLMIYHDDQGWTYNPQEN